MLHQSGKGRLFEGETMGALEVYGAPKPLFICVHPAGRTHAPLVPRLESRKPCSGRGVTVIATHLQEAEKGLCDPCAYGMGTTVRRIGIAASISKPTREGCMATTLEWVPRTFTEGSMVILSKDRLVCVRRVVKHPAQKFKSLERLFIGFRPMFDDHGVMLPRSDR